MAIVRKSLDEIRASRPKMDLARIENTTEADIRHQAAEDGADPDAAASYTLTYPAQAVRKRLKMTQEEFAAILHIPLATLRNWEQGRTVPDPAARALLTIVAKEPEAALRALEQA